MLPRPFPIARPPAGDLPGYILSQRPIAYYPMQETSGNIVDIVGGLTGTAFGGLTYRQPGPGGTMSVRFDGTSGYFDLGNRFGQEGNPRFSIVAFGRPNGITTGRRLVSKIQGAVSGWEFVCQDGALRTMRFNASGTDEDPPVIIGGVTDGEWSVHVARHDGSNLYYDTRNGSDTAVSPVTLDAGNLNTAKIGRQSNAAPNFWLGDIAHVAFFDRCLSPEAVARLKTFR